MEDIQALRVFLIGYIQTHPIPKLVIFDLGFVYLSCDG